jgi:hypothetical protein
MRAVIFGDWETVIGSRQYRDKLIDQMPDADMADWHRYQIECSTPNELVSVFNEFQVLRKLRVEFEFGFVSEDRAVFAEARTGFDGDGDAQCSVGVEIPEHKVISAAIEAIGILSKAIA